MKRLTYIFCLCAALFSVSAAYCAAPQLCVVIDPGHGGKDPGTVWGKHYEKNINLAVAKAAGRIIEEKMAHVKVVYTRSNDTFITLAGRTDIANNASADIFISIHTNSAPARSACGTETYVMGVDKSKANLGVAMRENGVISLESNYSERYEGYDPQSTESLIMFSLMQYSYRTESIALAQILQTNFKNEGRVNRGVKQEAFLVLWRTSMPAILTELGYLSNEAEAKYLISEKGQNELASAIASAAIEYLKEVEKDGGKIDATKVKADGVNTKSDQNSSNEQSNIKFSYGVQIKSSSSKIAINSMNFGRYVTAIKEYFNGKYYKYVVGECVFYKEALLLQDKLRQTYADAFVVAYDENGNQITVSQARSREN